MQYHHRPAAPRTAWEPARPVGTRWQRLTDSVRLLTNVVGIAAGDRTSRMLSR